MISIRIYETDETVSTESMQSTDIIVHGGVVVKNRWGAKGGSIDTGRLILGFGDNPIKEPEKVVNVSHHHPSKSYRFEQLVNDVGEIINVVHVPISNLPTHIANKVLAETKESMCKMGFERVMAMPFRD